MKHFKRANIYKNSTGSNKFDLNKYEAYSYDWWCFFRKINGKNVFNNYFYSPSTSRHQANVRSLLRELGIQIDLEVACPAGLQSLDAAKSVNTYYANQIDKLKTKMAKPRSRKSKNEERQALIDSYTATSRAFDLLVKEAA